MSFLDLVVGRPLASSEERAEQIGPARGIPIFGLDALGSAAYGPEAALTLLIPLGLAGLHYTIPISAAIVALLLIVYFSYRQTIAAYPHGGGSYTVARYNLGARLSLLAAAALLTDYILTAAVGISAGVGALISAVPALQPHTLRLCLGVPIIVTVGNLRAARKPGVLSMTPASSFFGRWLVEVLAGVPPLLETRGYKAILPLLPGGVLGGGVFYCLAIASILWVLSFQPNTALADSPRLCRAVAQNNYLPHAFRFRGRRLVYSYGIVSLAVLTGLLLIFFDGVTDKLIPLFAIGAFLAFTLSQAGMVVHWRKKRGPHWRKSALVNGFGAVVTGLTVCIVLVAKFAEGAWITLFFIPLVVLLFGSVRRHYHSVRMRTQCLAPVTPHQTAPP